MGVLNLTPDSFSDGGMWNTVSRAVERAHKMLDEGADLIDLGAESTRPGGGVYGEGAREVPADEEIDRLLPVLETLRAETEAPISVDTRKALVAQAALEAGADLINDVSALADPAMAPLLATASCPVVLMHSRGSLAAMQKNIRFDDVAGEVRNELLQAMERGERAGIDRSRIVIDPGIGFGKTVEQNLEILRRVDTLARLGPVLVGASRKSFIGVISGAKAPARLAGSLAAVGWAARGGAAIVRVHDVAETVQFLEVWRAISGSKGDTA